MQCGRKACETCYRKIQSNLANVETKEDSQNSIKSSRSSFKDEFSYTPTSSENQDSDFCSKSQQKRKLENMFESIGLPALERIKENDTQL